jgi:hypothetical protein
VYRAEPYNRYLLNVEIYDITYGIYTVYLVICLFNILGLVSAYYAVLRGEAIEELYRCNEILL